MNTVIIDYGMGNLGSLRRALEEVGAQVTIADHPDQAAEADHLLLPGVGSFADGMARLCEHGWPSAIQAAVRERRVPLLGICLGMQLLSDKGYEGGEVPGLGLIAGEVVRLMPDLPSTRIPHMGWNEVHFQQENPLFRRIPDGTDFFFVHSYHFQLKDPRQTLAMTPYCNSFVSIVGQDNVWGTQFHPEKSQRPGMQLLRNFLELN